MALNSDVALECDVLDANPPPQIKWFDDQGEIQEMIQGNNVRFLDGGHYLYLRRLHPAHLERQYYCTVTNANLSQEVSSPIRYVLTDNLPRGVLKDYKQIGDLTAFVGNTSIEFAYVGGVFGDNSNETFNTLLVNDDEVSTLGNVGKILHDMLLTPGTFMLIANVDYNETRRGTLTVYRKLIILVHNFALCITFCHDNSELPRITNTLQDEREHLVGEDNLTYICEFEGFPHPRVMFYFNGARIQADSTSGVIVINNTLIIPSPQVSHSGIYQCIVSNEFGDDQAAWLLEIREPSNYCYYSNHPQTNAFPRTLYKS